jgi:serine/threonine protein phosphatase PrpC
LIATDGLWELKKDEEVVDYLDKHIVNRDITERALANALTDLMD